MLYNKNISLHDNVKANIVANNLAKGRWGNKFRKYFNRHKESIYGEYPAYSFKEGMKECTKKNGTTSEEIETLEGLADSLNDLGEGTFNATVQNTTNQHRSFEHDIKIVAMSYVVDGKEHEYNDDVLEVIEELILEDHLYDDDVMVNATEEIIVAIQKVKEYIKKEIEALTQYEIEAVRAKDDLELINHLGMCGTLAKEIDRPTKIKSIYFRFRKNVTPTKIYKDNIFVGYDEKYEWWKEKQFKQLIKHIKDFKKYCTFVVGKDDGSTSGRYTESYVYVDASFLTLPGIKIFYFVQAFLDVNIRAKKNLFLQLVGVLIFVIGIYLTAISANPTWMKIAMIAASIGSYSGAISSDWQYVIMIATFAYGAYNTDFGSMSSLEMFQWAFENIDVVLATVQKYENRNFEEGSSTDENRDDYEEHDRITRFIYSDAYDQYRIYNDLISVNVEI